MEHVEHASLTQRSASHEQRRISVLPHVRSPRSAAAVRANEAMKRYASGDDAAFNELYQSLAPRLYRHCLWLCGQNDAEELMQEVFIKLHRARASFVDCGGVLAWALTVARTTHLDRARYRRRRHETVTEQQHLERYAAAVSDLPSQRALHAELARELSLLSDTVREAYVLVKLEGMSCADASAALGISVHALKQRVHRATLSLRRSLSELLDAA